MTFSPDRTTPPLLLVGRLTIAAVLALGLASPGRADTAAARSSLARSLAALDRGNASGARALARQAVAADPDWGLAHAVLARTALAEGDGVTAEAELTRAHQSGVDPRRTRQLVAHARLLQGDPQGALRKAKATAPRYWTYGLRIQARALAAMGNPGAANDVLAEAVARSAGVAAVWTDLGQLRRSVGDTVGAIEATTRAVALDPDDSDALLLRGQLVRTQFGLEASLPWFAATLKRDPYRHDALIDHAATLGEVGRTVEMLVVARRALAVHPGSPRALYILAVMAARAGNTDLARSLLQRTGGALDGMPGALLLGATLDIDNGAHEQAVAKLRNLIGIQPMNLRARQLLGAALLRTGAPRDALAALRPIALRGDADSYTLTLVARAFEATGERDWAARFFDRAAIPARDRAAAFGADSSAPVLAAAADGLDAGEPSTAVPLIRGLLDEGDRSGALALAQTVADANRGSAAAANVLGDTLMVLGRPADAIPAYRRAATIAFDEPAMLRLTEALEAAGARADAANTLALFLSQNPNNVAALRLAAHWQIAAGDHQAAIDTLEGLRARLGDRDAALLAELAYANAGAGRTQPAESYAAAAYAIAPANAAAAGAYGWSLYGAGDPEGARQLLEKAVALAPVHPLLRRHLAEVKTALGTKAGG